MKEKRQPKSQSNNEKNKPFNKGNREGAITHAIMTCDSEEGNKKN